jgi:hypothetical protein
MAQIASVTACELAFFDRQDRLCLIGVTTRLPVPRLPLAINQLMLVARLTHLRTVEELEVRVEVLTPNGMLSSPTEPGCITIDLSGEYVLVTLRGVPILQEGVYGFQVSLAGQLAVGVNIPVLMVGATSQLEVH